MNILLITILPAVLMLSAGCRTSPVAHAAGNGNPPPPPVERYDEAVKAEPAPAAIPRAVIYRTNGDYNDRVMVILDSSRTSLVSFPAPSDVTRSSSPLVMAGGWLLDRRGGIGYNSAFLDWTYADYSALPSAPSPSEIVAHIIPGARVTALEALPLTATEALADTALVNRLILHP